MVRTALFALVAILALAPVVEDSALAQRGRGAGAAGVGVRPGAGVGAPGVGVVNPVARGIVATGRYIAALPAGCVSMTVGTEVLQKCGTIYYRAHGAQYEVVGVQ